MTDMQEALTLSGIIFGAMMVSQYGRRKYSFHKIAMPIVTVAVVGYFYLQDMPTDRVDWVVYGVGAVIGVFSGILATVTTGVERDARGTVRTRCGPAFVAVWVAVIGIRLAFIALADHNNTFRQHLGDFMATNHIVVGAIAPFFVIWALGMVLSRVAFLYFRVQALGGRRAPVAAAGVYAGVR